MRSLMVRALLAPVMCCALGAQDSQEAPSAAPWTPVLELGSQGLHLQARLVQVDGVPCVQFRNQGKSAIHFQAWVDGVQTREQGLASPRIHLNLHQRSAFIPLPAGVVHPTFKVGLIRSGADRGDWTLE